jgi:hypothetical protein
MAKKLGRKPIYEELKIKERFAALAPKAFAVMEELLDSDDINDRKWAVEQCAKGFARMIPTEVTGEGGGAIEISWMKATPTIHADANTNHS